MRILIIEEKTVIKKIESMRDEIVEFLQDLVKIPSEVPPGRYKEISKFIESKLLELGIKTQRKKNNIIGEIGSETGPTLIFNAHLDTDATTDATFFHQKGIETILIGTIRGDNNIHSTDEFIYIEDLINVTKIYALTALNYLK